MVWTTAIRQVPLVSELVFAIGPVNMYFKKIYNLSINNSNSVSSFPSKTSVDEAVIPQVYFFNACLCQDKQYIFCKEHSSLHLHSENFFSKVALTDSNGNEVAKLVQTANCLQFFQIHIYFNKIEKLLLLINL